MDLELLEKRSRASAWCSLESATTSRRRRGRCSTPTISGLAGAGGGPSSVLACPSIWSIGGINVNLVLGASAANVSITNPIKNGTLGSINLNPDPGTNTAVIQGAGPTAR